MVIVVDLVVVVAVDDSSLDLLKASAERETQPQEYIAAIKQLCEKIFAGSWQGF